MKLVKFALVSPIIAISVAVFAALGAQAAKTINVPGDYAAIADAVENADPGDTIAVAAGTYEISNMITVDKFVRITGAGRDKTIITNTATAVVANRTGAVLYLNDPDAVVEGVTLAGGRYSKGGTPASGGWGAYVAAGTLQDARVTNCRGGHDNMNDVDGAAVNVKGANARVLRTIIDNNVRVNYNTAMGAGLRIDQGTVSDCLIVNNRGASGAGVYMAGKDSHLVNCTVAKNRLAANQTNYHGGGLYFAGTEKGSTIENCIFALNDGNDGALVGGDDWYAAKSNILAGAMSNCAVLKGAAIGTDSVQLSVDPFVDAEGGDFTVRLGAPCVGIGYAATTPTGVRCGITADRTVAIRGTSIGFAAVLYGTDGTESVEYAWSAKDEDGNPVDLGLEGGVPSAVFSATGRYTVHVEAKVNGGAWTACPNDLPVLVGAPTNYVTDVENPGAAYPYDTPETAGNDLQTVIDAAVDGAVVLCGEGMWVLSKQIEIVKPIKVVGAGIGESILSGYDPNKKTYGMRLVFMNHPEAVLEGFTLSDTIQDRSAALLPDGYEVAAFLGGWAAYVMNGTMLNCRVTNCKGSYGNLNNRNGAAVNLGAYGAVLSHCILDGNVRTGLNTALGCGVLLDGGQADNCLICGNEGGHGVGVYVAAAGSRLLNCTIADNATKSAETKYQGGGLYFAKVDDCRIENCILARNSSADGGEGAGQWYAADKSKLNAAMKNCAFLTGTALGAAPVTLTADPFAGASNGDYHLTLGTTARNNGCLYAEMAETDLEGNPRVVDGKVDIGCYQYVSSGIICDILADETALARGETVHFTPVVEGAATVQYEWTATDEKGAAVDLGLAGANPSWTADRYGHFKVHLRVSADGTEWYDSASDAAFAVNARTNYVTVVNANAAFPWDTPETAATNAQDVIDEALDGNVIRFAAGQYPIREQLYIEKKVTLLGAGMDCTVLSNAVNGSGGHRLVCLNHKDARMDGFTLTRGRGDDYQESGKLGKVVGGWGVYIQAGTFANGRVTACSCDWMNATGDNGAAVNLQTSDAVLTHCIVDNNARSGCNTAQGAGVRIVGGKVDNCLIYGNVGTYGAGITLCGNAAEVWNCTVVSNDAMSALADEKTGACGGGIGICSQLYKGSVAGSKVWNCVFAFNRSRLMNRDDERGGGEWSVSENDATALAALKSVIENCAFYKGPENGNAEPIGKGSFSIGGDEFRNPGRLDYRLRRNAKCVDKGLDDAWKEGDVDLLDARRKVGEHVDIGCYEFPWNGLMLMVR